MRAPAGHVHLAAVEAWRRYWWMAHIRVRRRSLRAHVSLVGVECV